MVTVMPTRILVTTALIALWGIFTAVFRWLASNILGGFADDWASGLLGSVTGIKQSQVIDALASWLPSGLVVGVAMWAAYVFSAWRSSALLSNATPFLYRRKPQSLPVFIADTGKVQFDYSTNNGLIRIGTGERLFVLRFTKASKSHIHFNKDGTNLQWIACTKGTPSNSILDFSKIDKSSVNYSIGLTDIFIAKNAVGHIMQGRVYDIKDDQRGDERDEVYFVYNIDVEQPSDSEPSLIAVVV